MPNETFNLDFIGIGAPKCGTTWVSQCLREHPEIEVPKRKDSNFFLSDEFLEKYYPEIKKLKCGSWEELSKLFRSTDNNIRGEFSPNYLFDETARSLIKHYNPTAKLLVCLRDPVDSMYSAFWYFKSLGRFKSETFEQAIEDDEIHLELWRFGRYLREYFEEFSEEQLHVVFFKDIKENPVHVLKSLYSYLGADREFVPPSLDKRVNFTVQPRFKKIDEIGKKVAKNLRDNGMHELVLNIYKPYKILNTRRFMKPKMKKQTREKLIERYSKEIELVESLTGRRLPHWRNV